MIKLIKRCLAVAGAAIHARKQATEAYELERRSGQHDIMTHIENGRIAFQATGNGLFFLDAEIKNSGSSRLTVRIPIGCTFEASGDYQNMAATETTIVKVRPGKTVKLILGVVCVNARRRVPGSRDSFFRCVEGDAGVARVLAAAARKAQNVRQLAVWIVTDNIDFETATMLFGIRHIPYVTNKNAVDNALKRHKAQFAEAKVLVWREVGSKAIFSGW
jgi:hypothetical protein